jgi:hypothetical protein
VGGLVTSAAKVRDTSSRIEDEEYQVDRETSDVIVVVTYCTCSLQRRSLVVKTRMTGMAIAPFFFAANSVDRCPMEDSIWSEKQLFHVSCLQWWAMATDHNPDRLRMCDFPNFGNRSCQVYVNLFLFNF